MGRLEEGFHEWDKDNRTLEQTPIGKAKLIAAVGMGVGVFR